MEPWYSGTTGTRQALLTAILELGAWIGALINGWLADAVGRRITVVIACFVFTVGVIVQACTLDKDYVLAGRFVTGIGVGAFSMLVPLYVQSGPNIRLFGMDSLLTTWKGTTPNSPRPRCAALSLPSNSSPLPLESWSLTVSLAISRLFRIHICQEKATV